MCSVNVLIRLILSNSSLDVSNNNCKNCPKRFSIIYMTCYQDEKSTTFKQIIYTDWTVAGSARNLVAPLVCRIMLC